MNSPEPRLNKLPFIVTDACCLAAVALIGLLAKDPFAPVYFVSAVSLVVIGAIALVIPYLADFAADSKESSARLRNEMETQIARLSAAGESLARAAAQIKAVEEAVHKSARDAETLPYRMQEKLAEFNEALAAKENEEREALERELEELRASNSVQLKAVAEKIHKATTDWAALEQATRKQLAAAQDALAKLQAGTQDAGTRLEEKLSALVRQVDEKLTASKPAPAATPTKAPPPPPPPEPEPAASAEASDAIASFVSAIASAPAPAASDPVAVAPESFTNGEPSALEAKPKKPRAPRKPKPEDTLAAMSETFVEPVTAVAEPPPAPADESNGHVAADMIASTSSDGATRLLATAYIGIGNKLFIRGDGPGLSWDRGVPMQFVSIGKWGWHTHDAAGPVRIKLYKNDESAALSGELTLDPGRHTEITALF